MGVLDKVMQMQNQGISENDIVKNLQQQGISPKEISDALNQSQIKSAVSNTDNMENMQESIMEQSPPTPSKSSQYPKYSPQTQEISQEQYQPPQQYSQTEYAPYEQQGQNAYQQEAYTGDQYLPEGTGVDTNTIIEIADQVFTEKIEKIEKKIDNLNEFKTLTKTKVENISERLKKIETIMDKLQIAILEKIGSYGQNLESIKKEMTMMQDSFGKVINPIADRTETRANLKLPVSATTTPKKISKFPSNKGEEQCSNGWMTKSISTLNLKEKR